tara:strand:+ start:67 stop:348 length:282 start_codon:yes stop_codon:yes gene_type:complete
MAAQRAGDGDGNQRVGHGSLKAKAPVYKNCDGVGAVISPQCPAVLAYAPSSANMRGLFFGGFLFSCAMPIGARMTTTQHQPSAVPGKRSGGGA